MLTILFDGIAYGMLLFVLACGLAVTLGLMNFVNLAHGAFAMAGGYCTVILVNRWGVPFFAALPLAFLFSALLGFVLERTLYVHVYRKPPSRPGAVHDRPGVHVGGRGRLVDGLEPDVRAPARLAAGAVRRLRRRVGRYRLLIIVVCGLLTLGLQLILSRTRFGSRLRAAVDDARVARGLGINVDRRVRPHLRRSARGLPGSAARWARRSSASIRPSR